MTTHDLKCWPVYFAAIKDGSKPFEVRKEDNRIYCVGDVLRLREWDRITEKYTGREVSKTVTYVLAGSRMVAPGHVVLGLGPAEAPHA
ncbi:MAG TPA: DUF3850 domain-containing protein [Gemmatimonadales bacterium]|nr:DUF3850 domain-containing protein [Gemmatimonadales bacterium]